MTRWNRPLVVLCAAMAALTVVSLVGVVADDRVLTGAPIWLKVFKFSVSIVLYSATIAWILSVLPRRSRAAERAAVVLVGALTVEMIIITGQVIRGRTSHFNNATTLDGILFNLMGTAILALWFAQLVITIAVARRPLADRTAALGIRLGLAVSLLGAAAAVPMTLPLQAQSATVTGAHSVGVPDGGPGLPLVGWSTTGGDLRVGHFVGLHALQALPLLAWLLIALARRGSALGARLDETTRVRLVGIAGAAYAALVVLLTWQALRGQPLLRPDALTLAASGMLVAATAAAAAGALRRRPATVEVPDLEPAR
ncbi:hypothetical protein [Spirilliplanes yamanashiensis]|uniref:Uncharacterized protein n=1 Tax=Spirilliplanes yamanashiensis TaxID=42233 RepID=A0A8J3YB61_9ACTN|nr:hypothetical protein [Spirilliplanes yamanashiensis]MDP9817713.1 hypothetical protein [Spirilliplanes yamanashiensis]GIJ04523.1 hypothetical protein Sya03_38750 [Spirilliplanes yamanashiensis]